MQYFKSEKIFLYSLLIFAFLLPISRAGISFFLIWFMLLFFIRKDYIYIWQKIKNKRIFYAIGSLLCFLALSILWSENKIDALNQIRLYSYWCIIPILAININREWIPNIITSFLFGMLISELIAYGIYFEWWTIKDRIPLDPSPFMNHIHYSIFLAFTSILLFSRLLSKRYTWHSKLPMFLFFLTATGNLIISTGRIGQLAFFLTMAIAIIIHYKVTLKSLIIFTGLIFILTVGSYRFIEIFQTRVDQGISDIRELQKGNFNTSWGLRAAFWIITYDIVHEHPLIGVGLGDYRQGARDAIKNNSHQFDAAVVTWCSDTHFHSQYLMVLTQIGLIGFGLMIWVIIELFKLKINNPELNEFKILGLSVYFIGSIAEPLWILQFPIILFVFITSVSLAASYQNNESNYH